MASIDSLIPSGSWTLYFHSIDENKWDINSFHVIRTFKTWHDLHATLKKVVISTIGDGMFFLMRDPIPPLWENSKNIRGGNYSFRAQRADAGETFVNVAIACMLDRIMVSAENRIHGISISPKKGFNIVKIWNADSTKYNKISDMVLCVDGLKSDDVLYTPFLEKKM